MVSPMAPIPNNVLMTHLTRNRFSLLGSYPMTTLSGGGSSRLGLSKITSQLLVVQPSAGVMNQVFFPAFPLLTHGHSSQTDIFGAGRIPAMTPDTLVRTVEDFLAEARDAVVLEDGAVAFDLARAKYSVSGEHNKCLLHLWSAERNVVGRVLDVEVKDEVLRLAVQRLGQARPTKLEICRERDRRTPTAKRAARLAYQQVLRRVLERRIPGLNAERLSTSMDLERSFGPIYARGLLKHGQSGFAVLGVNEQETQASIDATLTFGILWLEASRQAQAGKLAVEGLKLFLPAGSSSLTCERMAHLHSEAAKWQLYELDEREDCLREMDVSDRGNVTTRLVHWTDDVAALERVAEPIACVRGLMPEAEVV